MWCSRSAQGWHFCGDSVGADGCARGVAGGDRLDRRTDGRSRCEHHGRRQQSDPGIGPVSRVHRAHECYYASRGKSVGTCYWHNTSHCYEPSAIRTVLKQMIVDASASQGGKKRGMIDLLLQDRAVRMLAKGNTGTGVVRLKGRTLHSKVLIDATEYGDVLPLTPARYRSGRTLGPATQNICTQDLTYVMVIKKYPHGVPAALWMKTQPPEYDLWLPALRVEWQRDGNPRTRDLPIIFANHNAYRSLPDSSNPENYVSSQYEQITRTDLNWFNDYPTTTAVLDREARQHILCEAELKTLVNLYSLQHELKETQWFVADDESSKRLLASPVRPMQGARKAAPGVRHARERAGGRKWS